MKSIYWPVFGVCRTPTSLRAEGASIGVQCTGLDGAIQMSLPRRSAGFTSYLLTLYHNNAGRYGKGSATPGSSCSENPRLGIKANIMV